MAIKNSLHDVNHIIAGEAAEGTLLLDVVKKNASANCHVQFVKAFNLDNAQMERWGQKKNVLIVDIANSKGFVTGEVAKLLMKIIGEGHKISGVIDDSHDDRWRSVFSAAGIEIQSVVLPTMSAKEERSFQEKAFNDTIAVLDDALPQFGW